MSGILPKKQDVYKRQPYDNAEPVPATYEDLSLYTFTEGFAPQAEPAEQA